MHYLYIFRLHFTRGWYKRGIEGFVCTYFVCILRVVGREVELRTLFVHILFCVFRVVSRGVNLGVLFVRILSVY